MSRDTTRRDCSPGLATSGLSGIEGHKALTCSSNRASMCLVAKRHLTGGELSEVSIHGEVISRLNTLG